MLLALASLALAAAVTAMPADAGCPSQEAVEAELDRLGASAALAALGSLEVTVAGTKMRVSLLGRDGAIMGTREVAAPEACHERASVAAVFLAAWVGKWSTQPLPNPTSTTSGEDARGASTERLRSSASNRTTTDLVSNARMAPSTVAVPPPAPLPTAKSTAPAASSPPPALLPSGPAPSPAPIPASTIAAAFRPNRAPIVELAGLGFGTHDGDAGTFGAAVSAAYRFGGALAIGALLETTGERETTLGPGFAAYRTSRFGVGAGLLQQRGHFFTDAGIFPELTMLYLSGRGQQLDTTRSATAWGASVDLRGRLGLAAGRFIPFLFGGGSIALRVEHLTLVGVQPPTTLSRWNLSAGAGLAFLLGENE
jgi:hypothetical protein